MGEGVVWGVLATRRAQLVRFAVVAFALGALAGVVDRVPAVSAPAPTPSPRRTAGAARPFGALRIVWAGDIVLGSDAGAATDDGRALFAHVTDQVTSADVAIGNLEGTLTQQGYSKCAGSSSGACFAFRAPATTAVALHDAGFDALNVANNHANDYGDVGQKDTLDALKAQGLAWAGKPGVVSLVHSGGRTIALVGFSCYPWSSDMRDLPGVRALVGRAKAAADIVIVLMHAGAEGTGATHVPEGVETAFGENRGDTRAFAHAAIDAGADVVLGSGPHVLRGIERYQGRLIAYSLGDFAAWGVLPTSGVMGTTGLLELDVAHDGRPLAGRLTSLKLESPGIPVDDPDHAAADLVTQLSQEDFGAGGVTVDRYGQLKLG